MISSQGHSIERPKYSTTSWGHKGFHWHHARECLWDIPHPRELEVSIRDTVEMAIMDQVIMDQFDSESILALTELVTK